MQPQTNHPASGTICVAAGYGIKIHIRHGHLTVEDGRGRDRRTRRYNRATSQLRRLVVLGQSGYVTLDALQWLRDVGAAFVQVDTNGRLISISGNPGTDRPVVRRAQALAGNGPAGIEFARWVLTEKLGGQCTVLTELPDRHEASGTIRHQLRNVQTATSLESILGAEAQAASAYWSAWTDIPVCFAASARIPDHWRAFGQRHSPLTASPRLAVNPANAILNYLYSLIEAETTIACYSMGLDPGLGVFHLDRQGRSSLTLDLMEAIRPIADAYVIALLTKRTLSAKDFVETRRGTCRILRPLASQLAKTTTVWGSHAARVVEAAARILSTAADKPIRLPTPLTNVNRETAWDPRRTAPTSARVAVIELPATCRECGGSLPDRRRRYCVSCQRARFRQAGPQARASAEAVLDQLRQDGRDPAHGGRAAQVRGAKNASHQQAVRDWKGELPDPAIFSTNILPGLRDVPIGELVAATGLSEHYCSLIRLGKRVPHPRHWETLRSAAIGVSRHATSAGVGL